MINSGVPLVELYSSFLRMLALSKLSPFLEGMERDGGEPSRFSQLRKIYFAGIQFYRPPYANLFRDYAASHVPTPQNPSAD